MEGSQGIPIYDASDIHNGPNPVHQGKCRQPEASGKSSVCDPEVGERHPVLVVENAGGVRAGEVYYARLRSSSYPPPNPRSTMREPSWRMLARDKEKQQSPSLTA